MSSHDECHQCLDCDRLLAKWEYHYGVCTRCYDRRKCRETVEIGREMGLSLLARLDGKS